MTRKDYNKKMSSFFCAIGLLLLASCTNNNGEMNPKNKLNLPEGGFEFTLIQRNQTEVPSDSGNVICRIEDIKRGHTQLLLKSGNTTLVNRRIYEGSLEYFSFNDENYTIECLFLKNKVIGADFARFRILHEQDDVVDEAEEIERLLSKIEQADVIFIRNGTEYSGQEAAEHLRSKWEQSDGEIKTLDDFIEKIASKSSFSGKAYTVKLKDGRAMDASDWYQEQMKD